MQALSALAYRKDSFSQYVKERASRRRNLQACLGSYAEAPPLLFKERASRAKNKELAQFVLPKRNLSYRKIVQAERRTIKLV